MPPPPPVGAGVDPARDPPVAPSDAVAVPASARPSPSHDDAPPASASSGAKKKKLGKKERQRLRAMAAGTYVPPTLPTKAPKKPTIARQPYAGGVAPSLLTRYIREAWTPESLLETCDRYAAKMNHIHAGAAWNSLAKLATNPAHPDRDWALRVDGALLERLVQRTIAIVPTMGPRELANAAHGVAKSGLPKIAAAAAKKKTIRPFGTSAGPGVDTPESTPVPATGSDVDAAARSDASPLASAVDGLLGALARAIRSRLGDCTPQELANAAWAFAKAGGVATGFVRDLLRAIETRASASASDGGFNPQELTNAAWAAATLTGGGGEGEEEAAFGSGETGAAGGREARESAEAAHDGWADSLAGCFDALARAALALGLAAFTPQGVSTTAWAHAKARGAEADAALFLGVAERVSAYSAAAAPNAAAPNAAPDGEIERPDAAADSGGIASHHVGGAYKNGRCNARDLANLAWALARTDGCGGAVDVSAAFAGLARLVVGERRSFDARGLATTAWAFARAGAEGVEGGGVLFERLGEEMAAKISAAGIGISAEATPRDLANCAWAFARACRPNDALFAALASAIRDTVDGDPDAFNAQDLVNAAWAFAKTGRRDRDAFDAFEKAASVGDALRTKRLLASSNHEGGGPRVDPRHVANLVWAFSTARRGSEALFSALAGVAERECAAYSPGALAAVAWTFANVDEADTGRTVDGRRGFRSLAWRSGAFRAFAEAAERAILESGPGAFTPEEAENVEWAFKRAGTRAGPEFRKAAKARGRVSRDGGGGANQSGPRRATDPEGFFGSLERSGAANPHDRDGVTSGLAKDAVRGGSEESGLSPAKAARAKAFGTVVVAGGGIGGAAVAAALQREGFTCVVLEADAAFDARKQGYGLTVQGTEVRDGLGIDLAADDAPSTSHYTFDAEGRVLAFYGEAFLRKGGSGGGGANNNGSNASSSMRFVHLPRQALRRRLLDAVAPGTIRWGAKLASFDASVSEGVSIALTSGEEIRASLLVGADGIFSAVRKGLKLPNDRLKYVGLIVALGIVPDERMEVRLARERVFETVDGAARVYAMPFTRTSTMWQLSFPCCEAEAKRLSGDPEALKAALVKRCEGWHDPVPAMLRATRLEDMSGYPVYDRDALRREIFPRDEKKSAMKNPSRRVTLVGDAAHPMTPFKAQGANQAVADATLLAAVLSSAVQREPDPERALEAALPEFERRMLDRSARVVEQSREKAREMHSPLALRPARKRQREGVRAERARMGWRGAPYW